MRSCTRTSGRQKSQPAALLDDMQFFLHAARCLAGLETDHQVVERRAVKANRIALVHGGLFEFTVFGRQHSQCVSDIFPAVDITADTDVDLGHYAMPSFRVQSTLQHCALHVPRHPYRLSHDTSSF